MPSEEDRSTSAADLPQRSTRSTTRTTSRRLGSHAHSVSGGIGPVISAELTLGDLVVVVQAWFVGIDFLGEPCPYARDRGVVPASPSLLKPRIDSLTTKAV